MKLTIDTSHRLPESRIKHKCYLPLVRKGKRCEIEKPRRRIKSDIPDHTEEHRVSLPILDFFLVILEPKFDDSRAQCRAENVASSITSYLG